MKSIKHPGDFPINIKKPKYIKINKAQKKIRKIISKRSSDSVAKRRQAKYKIPNTVSFSTFKIYKYGERGSGFTVEGEPQDFYKLREECLQQGILFTDPQFPAEMSSIFTEENPSVNLEWKRPKDILNDPHFEVDGFSRFDVKQGDLGDCWLLAAIANLTLYPNIFHNVVVKHQSFSVKYTGIFHFRFWQYGRWVDVVIDDRLPVNPDGNLRFLHSTAKNEFWPALLEKAYAKLHGSYQALEGGIIIEALTDFTGGISQIYKILKNTDTSELYELLLKAYERNALLSCAANPHPVISEYVTPEGIVKDHAYSITSVKLCKLETSLSNTEVKLLRLRNPWGGVEWNGPYSDQSSQWRHISEEVKQKLSLVFETDGEFWMSFEDFCKHFDNMQICYLRPDCMSEEILQEGIIKKYEMHLFEGEWVKGVTAGGCRNNLETFVYNPQYRIKLEHPDDDSKEKLCTLIVFLLQKHRRSVRKMGTTKFIIGISLFRLSDLYMLHKPLNIKFFRNNEDINTTGYIPCRQQTVRFKLPPGAYCIVPTTYLEDQEAEFILQVFTEKKCEMEENEDKLIVKEVDDRVSIVSFDTAYSVRGEYAPTRFIRVY